MNKHLESALKKIKKETDAKDRWYGYLRPDEIIALVEDGAKTNHESYVSYARMKKEKGDCGSTWFYFKLGRTKPHIFDKEQKNGSMDRKFNKRGS